MSEDMNGHKSEPLNASRIFELCHTEPTEEHSNLFPPKEEGEISPSKLKRIVS
jgi:hypothetical protein